MMLLAYGGLSGRDPLEVGDICIFQEGIPLEVGDIYIFQEGRIPILARLQEQNPSVTVSLGWHLDRLSTDQPWLFSSPAQPSTRAMKSDRMTTASFTGLLWWGCCFCRRECPPQ